MNGKIRKGALSAVVGVATAALVAPMAFAAVSDPWTDLVDLDAQYKVSSTDVNAQVYRIAGLNRVQTAIEQLNASEKWANKQANNYVIVARSDDFADALASGPLADLLDAPVLVAPSAASGATSLDSRVAAAIKEYGFKNVIFVGGTGVFPDAWRDSIKKSANVGTERVAGATRYDTALSLAKAMTNVKRTPNGLVFDFGDELNVGDPVWSFNNVNVYFATGLNYPDALTAGAAAAANEGVVLLTRDGKMDPRTEAAVLNQRDWLGDRASHIEYHAVGGQAKAALVDAGIRIDAEYVGADRYETSVKVAKAYPKAVPLRSLTVASGENYPDGVVAGAFAANHDGPLVLTRNAYVPPVVADYIRTGYADAAVNGAYTPVVVFGGEGSVSRAVSANIQDLLKV